MRKPPGLVPLSVLHHNEQRERWLRVFCADWYQLCWCTRNRSRIRERPVVCGEPGEEPGPVGLFSAAAEAVQHPPRCVGVYESTVAVPVDATQDGGEEAFGGGQRLVTCGEDAVGDQHLAQVGGAPAVRVGVESLVAGR